MPFVDRTEAGRRLAQRLDHLRGEDLVVLGLPRGGVPVAYEIARALNAPLDVIVIRKLGVPFQPELAMGALGKDGIRVTNAEVLSRARVDVAELAAVEKAEAVELDRRLERLRRGRARVPVAGRTAVIVDDGVATGATVLAIPIAPRGTEPAMADTADEVLHLETPSHLWSIGQWYEDFAPVSDAEVIDLLDRAAAPRRSIRPSPHAGVNIEVVIPAGAVELPGRLNVPSEASGVVLFAHGSGSSPPPRTLRIGLFGARRRCRRCGLPLRPTRSGRRSAIQGGRSHVADRRRPRRGRAAAQPGRRQHDALRTPGCCSSRRHPPVRGTRHPGAAAELARDWFARHLNSPR